MQVLTALSNKEFDICFGKIKSENGPDFLNQIFSITLDQIPEAISLILEAAEEEDFDTIAKKAHLLCGSFLVLNLDKGTQIAQKLELAAIDHDKVQIDILKYQIADLGNKLISYIREYSA